MSARADILARVRAACVPPAPTAVSSYRRLWPGEEAAKLARLVERLTAYGVGVLRATDAAAVSGIATARLAEQGVKSLIVPPDLPVVWHPASPVPVPDAGQHSDALARIDGVMTGCALAIAETGTLVLDAGAGQGRRALTLVPDYCLCVLRVEQVVGLVPEAIAQLTEAARAARPVTFVSGPSATADIELNRVVGVHGPRRLDVILVGQSS